MDNRNVLDEFKGMTHDAIVDALDRRGVALEIAIENTLRDFNMGTIVRSANAFGVRRVHVIGRRQWNRRGAMMTDKYLAMVYHDTPEQFAVVMHDEDRQIIGIENNVASRTLHEQTMAERCVLVFGQEQQGLSDGLLAVCDAVAHIDQLGSTRSLNVGVAAGIAMYEWSRRHRAGESC